MYYLPYFFATVKGMLPLQVELMSCAYPLRASLTTIFSGAAISKFGVYEPFMWAGSLIFVASSAMFLTLRQDSSIVMLIGSQVLNGIGFGAATEIPFMAVQVVLSKEDIATGSMSQLTLLMIRVLMLRF
jgi:Na+/melibiose symporter-like transporter